MTHGSLFSGIGGFDLAAEWIGWQNKFHCEWNEFGQKVLKHYWPEAESFNDITKTNFTKYEKKIDVLTGGFPCQPYSMAGKRKGKEDSRHLWPEMCRAIQEIKPRWIVGENVYGLVNWSGGLVFHEVQADLEAEGYEVFPYVLPAAGVGAPHLRNRVWFVATNTKCVRLEHCKETRNIRESKTKAQRQRSESSESFETNGINGNATNTDCEMLEHGNGEGKTGERAITEKRIESFSGTRKWETFPTVSPICDGNDGLSNRLDGITFSKWRKESIKAGGNAIVPQVALQIFKAIQEYENKIGPEDPAQDKRLV
jgi:DNA (cytosine-5)-methyltransferase 1